VLIAYLVLARERHGRDSGFELVQIDFEVSFLEKPQEIIE
jgi:hypothetical protein